MLKNIVRLEFIVNDKVYHFVCDNDSPLHDIKEALFQCQKYVGALEDNIKAQMEAKKAAEEAAKDPIIEENQEVIPDGDQQQPKSTICRRIA